MNYYTIIIVLLFFIIISLIINDYYSYQHPSWRYMAQSDFWQLAPRPGVRAPRRCVGNATGCGAAMGDEMSNFRSGGLIDLNSDE